MAVVLGGALSVSIITSCAGGDGPGAELTGSVPWEPPAEPERRAVTEREPLPPTRVPSVEVVTHGTKLIAQSEDAVTVLTLLELLNRGSRPRPLPRTVVRADVVAASRRAECEPTEVTIEGAPTLAPGERRLVWARTRCPIEGREPQVVRSFVWLPEIEPEAIDAGRTIVTAPGAGGEETVAAVGG